MPRTAARLLAKLFLSEGECSLGELARELKVSKASISTNARLLVGWGLVELSSQPGDRRDFYRASEDLDRRLLARSADRMHRVRSTMQDAEAQMPDLGGTAKNRLRRLAECHAALTRLLDEATRAEHCLAPRLVTVETNAVVEERTRPLKPASTGD